MNSKISFLRDTFLDAESDYLEELKKQPQYQKLMNSLSKYDARALSLEAVKRIASIENGNVPSENLEKVEAEITILLASIRESVRKIGARRRVQKSKDDSNVLEM